MPPVDSESSVPTIRELREWRCDARVRRPPVALLHREAALEVSDWVTEITHDDPEDTKGVRSVTEAIWFALRG